MNNYSTYQLNVTDEFDFMNRNMQVHGLVTEIDTENEMATVAYLLPSGKMFKETASWSNWNYRINRLYDAIDCQAVA